MDFDPDFKHKKTELFWWLNNLVYGQKIIYI